MSTEEYFENHKTVQDFHDGETVYLHVEGFGEVKTTYWDSHLGPGCLFDAEGNCYGTLTSWLENPKPMHCILAPPATD